MYTPFFALAVLSPGRQQAFRRAVVAHLALLAAIAWAVAEDSFTTTGLLGSGLLLAGIVEGALLVGWRLTQLPRSQALEFLLVSPLQSGNVFLAEALVGLARLALVILAGLPVLALLSAQGVLAPDALLPLLVMPFTWGAVTGLGLAVWAYESSRVRRRGERLALALVIVYLVLGVLGGEQLARWVSLLPGDGGDLVQAGVQAFLDCNPFGVLRAWLHEDAARAWPRALAVELVGLALVALLLWRGQRRLLSHFHERHYHPAVDPGPRGRGRMGERPLAWWAVRRVSQYSGRINLWLAVGFAVLYAAYLLAGPAWPTWLGVSVFVMVDGAGGVWALTTALVLLGAVPAAFQYGLWDSSPQERCRRLELLLLTRLGGRDYWEAAAAAAWQRGRGYFAAAVLLWAAALLAGTARMEQVIAALAAGVLLWALYFALGFRAFSRGLQANTLGLFLTVGLPLAVYCCHRGDCLLIGMWLPPGAVFAPGTHVPLWKWAPGAVLMGAATLLVARHALARCEPELRLWYERHHGRKVMS